MSSLPSNGFDPEFPDEGRSLRPITPNTRTSVFVPPDQVLLENDAIDQINNFNMLLESLEIDPKLKTLWKQIHHNAVTDRKNSMVVWADLYLQVHGSSEMHALHGDRLAKYMERLEKTNAQLLKLAELVYKVKEKLEGEEDKSQLRGASLFERLERQK